MLQSIPNENDIISLVGEQLYDVWKQLCAAIENSYDTERIWNDGGKKWTYEYKYRRGSKTLCAMYAKSGCIGLMIIFGKDERIKVEAARNELSEAVYSTYDSAKTYHDGKWVMFTPTDTTQFSDYLRLLTIKRKPNRKPLCTTEEK